MTTPEYRYVPRSRAGSLPAEPTWARRTKWSLLVLAVLLAGWTGFELVRTVLLLAEAPVTVVSRLPALEEAECEPPAGSPTAAPAVGEAAALREIRELRRLLEQAAQRATSPPARSPSRAAGPSAAARVRPAPVPPLLPGIERGTARAPSSSRPARPVRPLRIVRGPQVRLVGADALVVADVENRTARPFDRVVVLELQVDGRTRQSRRVRVRLAPHGRAHLSERFSTTLPDGTYSAQIVVPTWS